MTERTSRRILDTERPLHWVRDEHEGEVTPRGFGDGGSNGPGPTSNSASAP